MYLSHKTVANVRNLDLIFCLKGRDTNSCSICVRTCTRATRLNAADAKAALPLVIFTNKKTTPGIAAGSGAGADRAPAHPLQPSSRTTGTVLSPLRLPLSRLGTVRGSRSRSPRVPVPQSGGPGPAHPLRFPPAPRSAPPPALRSRPQRAPRRRAPAPARRQPRLIRIIYAAARLVCRCMHIHLHTDEAGRGVGRVQNGGAGRAR